jgi:twitching motility protein PilJ
MIKRIENLKIWQKLGLILLVMGIPLGTLAYFVYDAQNFQVTMAQDELRGTEYLKATRELLQQIPEHAASTAGHLSGDSSYRSSQQTAQAAIDNALSRLSTVNREAGAAYGASQKIETLQRDWQDLKGRADSLTVQANADKHSAFMAQVVDLIRQVADRSQLTLDPDPDSYYMMDLVTTQIPEITDSLSRARALGVAGGPKNWSESQRQQVLAAIAVAKARASAVVRSARVSAEKNPEAAGKMTGLASAASAAVDNLQRVANEGNASGREFHDKASAAVTEYLRLYEPANEILTGLVGIRLGNLNGQTLRRLGISFAVLLVALGIAFWVNGALAKQIRSLERLFEDIRLGNYQARAQVHSTDELGNAASNMNQMLDLVTKLVQSREERDEIQRSIQRLLDDVSGVADGDLSKQAEVTADMTGAIADSFNFMIDELRQVIGDVQRTTNVVSNSAGQIRSTAEHLATGSEAQSEQILKASTAIDQMTSSIQQVSNKAVVAADVANKARESAKQGAETVTKTIGGMEGIRQQVQQTAKRIKRLGESSQEIGEIVELISDIADRTSILALNASIQAAMAGEAGKGFAVVAEEVERLAERSTEATKKISGLIKSIQSDTNEAISAMEETTQEVVGGSRMADEAGRRLGEIESVSNQLAEIISGIASTAQQQAKGSESVARSVADISTVTQQTAAGAKQAAGSINELANLAGQLRDSMSRFKLPA